MTERKFSNDPIFRRLPVILVALMTLGSGIVNLWSISTAELPERLAVVREIFPIEFDHISRYAVLFIGFALVISALKLYRRKKRAYQMVVGLSLISVLFHMSTGLNYEESSLALVLAAIAWLNRRQFNVQSGRPDLGGAATQIFMLVGFAILYGVAGFWFLDKRQFGIDFQLDDSIAETISCLILQPDPDVIPRTHFAVWFLESFTVISIAFTIYGLFALFRPAFYRFHEQPLERLAAKRIVEAHGKSALDYFKYWPDKSYFFSQSKKTVIAYGVGRGFAVALGDPAGPDEEIEETIRAFDEFCRDNDWKPAFHQCLPDFLPYYQRAGFHKIKIGDDAVCDISDFSLEGQSRKRLRNMINGLTKSGVTFTRFEPPLSDSLLAEITDVSNEWLDIEGRRERTFTLGLFDLDYVKQTPVLLARDASGRLLGFLNEIPSHCAGEATIDLMRRRREVPDGLMDFLFVNAIADFKNRGFTRFNLGLTPMSDIHESDKASAEEKLIHNFFSHLNFLFSYEGLKHFKSKYATRWEPRYTVVKSVFDLPRFMLALGAVSEVKKPRR